MDVMRAIETRYSLRDYADRPVEKDKIEKILEAARLAPTAANEQKNRHIVVTDRELIRQMVPAVKDQKWVANAPAVLVECAFGDRTMLCGQSARSMDGAIAMSFMMLEIVELGMQCCWLGSFYPDKIRELLNIPEDYVVIAVTPFGYPAKEGKIKPKMELSEVVFYDRMGKSINPESL